MSVLETFDKWKGFLAERVDQAQKAGMSTDTITNVAFQIGQYLANDIDPQNGEERLLKELWESGNEEEKRVLAGLFVKLVDKVK